MPRRPRIVKPSKPPVVITGPGKYRMRNGMTAVIHGITPDYQHLDGERAWGRVLYPHGKAKEGESWNTTGRYVSYQESGWDIVEPLKEQS